MIGNKESLEKLARLLEAKSSEFNLTAIRDYEGIWEKHILDSLKIMNAVDLNGSRVLDLGTGAGFPGLPLAIENPSSEFVLLDSTRKKTDAVAEFVRELGVQNAKVIWGRAEEISSQSEQSKSYDYVISRAVAFLPEILELSIPFLKPVGAVIAMKSYNKKEIEKGVVKAKELGLKLIKKHKYKIDGDENNRVILVFKKSS